MEREVRDVAGNAVTESTRASHTVSTTTPSTTAPSTTAQSKAQRAYSWIKARISDGTYSPGYRLVLGQIGKDLGVSVVPVREAIRLLESEGLVTFERNVGAQVAMHDETEYLYTMQTLSVVEGAATAMSAPHIGAADIARARRINEQMIQCLEHFDPHRFTELNQEFHSVLFEHCPNPHILDLVHRGWARLALLRDSTFSFVPGRARASVLEHEDLLQQLEADAAPLDIELAARAHRTRTLDAFLDYQESRRP
jgi:DNA-binding GntR family transcriptional regulator